MTLTQARTAGRWLGRRVNKFGAKRTPGAYDRVYASKAEADYSHELALLERAGEISNVQCQPIVQLYAGVTFRPDFSFIERGQRVFVDVKGAPLTDRFRLIQKLWLADGPGELRVVTRGGRSFVVTKVIVPTHACATAHPAPEVF